MSRAFGKIQEFNVKTGNWTLYVERLEMYFKVNSIDKDMWLPMLIAGIGDETYELLSNLAGPKKPAELTYEAAVSLLKNHLQPKPSIMAERYHFRQRRQGAGENVAQYVSELKKLAKYCDFGANLEENLRDQLVCGLKCDMTRQRLFAKENLSYGGAVRLAMAWEAAERDAAAMDPTSTATAGVAAAAETSNSSGGVSSGSVHSVNMGRSRGRRPLNVSFRREGKTTVRCQACAATGHETEGCRFKHFTCSRCSERGHLRRACPQRAIKTKQGQRRVNNVATSQTEGSEESNSASEWEEELNQLSLNNYKPVSIPLCVDGVTINMEIDTGSAISCVSKDTYQNKFPMRPLEKSKLVLKFYDGSKVKPLGVIKPIVKYGKESRQLELFVIDGGTTSLLGRHWLTELKIQIPTLNIEPNFNCKIETGQSDDLKQLLYRHKEVFSAGLGRFTGGRATLRVREGVTPVFCRARRLPYALRGPVDAELDAMLREGIIEPVDTSEWATPLVPVRKADGGLRLCADYKVTLNPVLLVDRYPLPRIEDLLINLNGAQIFSKIDLSQAYNQIELDDSKELTVINTHRGLFKYNRLVYGLSSSPGIFQRIMSNLLKDIPGVEIFLDDIIIGTKGSQTDHLKILETVLQRLEENGIKLKKNKCFFMLTEVKYLGYIISKEGVKVDADKVSAILKIPRPKEVSQLRSFLGLINFYAKFIKNISSLLSPLYELLKKGIAWKWTIKCERAFKKVKEILTNAPVLAHYDTNKSLKLTCDASSVGIGGVLTQQGSDGRERPVIYVSRALSSCEKNYSQIEREAMAIVYCLKKLHQYLYGRRFTLCTDHKPLVSIFGPKNGVPAMAASRLQRWAIILSAYTYDIEYVSTNNNGADALSRLVVPTLTSYDIPEQSYLHFAQEALLLDYSTIKNQTMRDPLLGRVLSYIRDGWPRDNEVRELQPYFNRKTELYEELGCVMWGYRVIIPETCRSKVLSLLHEAHMGIVKTKAMARSYVWWPGIDEAVEAVCQSCTVCASEADSPQRHSIASWPWPGKPWSRIHVDFLGPIFNKIYLVVVDAHTKWIEVFPVPSTAAGHTISKLRELFGRWGIVKQIISDNGPPFSSKELAEFFKTNAIEHIFCAPYHPASNGAAENAVRTIKKVIKKAARQNIDVMSFVNTFLLHYRNTDHCTTGVSPASLMLGRRLRTRLDAIKPDRENKVREAQERQKASRIGVERVFLPGEEVWLRQYGGQHKWVPGQVSQKLGATDYRVVDDIGKEAHRHIDQLRHRFSDQARVSPEARCTPSEKSVLVQGEVDSCRDTVTTTKRASIALSEGASKESEIDDSDSRVVDVAPPPIEPPYRRPIRQCRLKRVLTQCN